MGSRALHRKNHLCCCSGGRRKGLGVGARIFIGVVTEVETFSYLMIPTIRILHEIGGRIIC